jgi:hypothetical protein
MRAVRTGDHRKAGDCASAWRYPEAWDMLMFGMRLGADPRTVVTTTPRPAKLIRDLVRDPICGLTAGGREIRTLGSQVHAKDGRRELSCAASSPTPTGCRSARAPPPKSSNYLPREFGTTVRPNPLAANPTIGAFRPPQK